MSPDSRPPEAQNRLDRFERLLSQAHFEGLKTILTRLCPEYQVLLAAVLRANTYEELLAGLGHRVAIARQIHVADCYSLLGQRGGIRAVLPYHDIPTQSSLPTLVNYDWTVTTTPNAALFFNGMLREFKAQLG